MIKKIGGALSLLLLGLGVGMSVTTYMTAGNQYKGAQKLISDCQRELKRTQQCILIAVEDEPKSAANDANNNN